LVFLDLDTRIVHHCLVTRWSVSGLLALLAMACTVSPLWGAEAASDAVATAASEPIDLTDGDAEAGAAEPESDEPAWMTAAHERRGGFAVGVMGAAVLGASEGFPNDALKINRFDHYTNTGAAGGGQLGIYIGVAAADWLVFGLGGHYGRMVTGELDTKFYGGFFHVDVFPAWPLGGAWRELGLYLDAGMALSNTTTFDDPDFELVEAGGASRVGGGLFYEGIRLSKLSMGPFIGYDQIWSPSSFRPAGMLGWRVALYVKP
jgi:hypothetical protein